MSATAVKPIFFMNPPNDPPGTLPGSRLKILRPLSGGKDELNRNIPAENLHLRSPRHNWRSEPRNPSRAPTQTYASSWNRWPAQRGQVNPFQCHYADAKRRG